jgi:putative transposase
VAKVHTKIHNQREDYLHRLTTKLVKESQFDVFCMEDLNLKGMSRVWGRKVSDFSYYTFQQMLTYKCLRYGKLVIKIGRFEPSSQICSHCGHRQKLELNERTYICPECGLEIDRDTNAALNIRNFALRDIIKNLDTDGTSGINACGDESSGSGGISYLNETVVNEARKSAHNKRANRNHLQ